MSEWRRDGSVDAVGAVGAMRAMGAVAAGGAMRCGRSSPRRARVASARALGIALAVAATLSSPPAIADAPDVGDLAASAEVILRGTCTRAEGRWDAASGLVVTDATIAVHEVVAGRAPALLAISEPGGVLPERNFGMVVPHAARFAPGEESVLLLARDRSGRLRVLGGSGGQLRVEREPAGGAARVRGEAWDALRAHLAARAGRGGGRP